MLYFVDGVRFHGYVSLREKIDAVDLDDLAHKVANNFAGVCIEDYMEIDAEVIKDEPDEPVDQA